MSAAGMTGELLIVDSSTGQTAEIALAKGARVLRVPNHHGVALPGIHRTGCNAPLHRYLGTPVITWVLNILFASHFSDIHCGMRGITKAALQRMRLQSQSWEYASEMVLKSVHMNLKTDEVPIRFRWFARFPYTRTVGVAAALFALGLFLTGWLLVYYVRHSFLLSPEATANYLGVTGLLLMIAGLMTLTFTLLLHSTAVVVWRDPDRAVVR